MRLGFVEHVRAAVKIARRAQNNRFVTLLELVDKVRPPGEPASGIVVSAAGTIIPARIAVVHELERLIGSCFL